jgi:anti-sigma regulatory factor (Ser/Thr protein kinase)
MHEAIELGGGSRDVPRARRAVRTLLGRIGAPAEVITDAAFCVTELVTNAMLHGGGAVLLRISVDEPGDHSLTRIEVVDRAAPTPPGLRAMAETRVVLIADDEDLDRRTGRGLAVLDDLADDWGVEAESFADGGTGKAVWVELCINAGSRPRHPSMPRPQLLVVPPPDPLPPAAEAVLADVPIRLFLASEAHLESLLRELQLMTAAGTVDDAALLKGLAGALRRNRAARSISLTAAQQQLAAGRRVMTMRFPVSDATPAAAAEFLGVVEVVESLTRRQLTLEVPESAELSEFRRWYVGELIRQASGIAAAPCPFQP